MRRYRGLDLNPCPGPSSADDGVETIEVVKVEGGGLLSSCSLWSAGFGSARMGMGLGMGSLWCEEEEDGLLRVRFFSGVMGGVLLLLLLLVLVLLRGCVGGAWFVFCSLFFLLLMMLLL